MQKQDIATMAGLQSVHNFNFSDFDGGISHLLASIETKSAPQVVNDLAIEVDYDVLNEVRNKLFGLCKDSHECRLKEKGIIGDNESLDIALVSRHRKDDNDTLAKDTVKLYEFAVGLKETFPKEVLTRQSKMKDIVQADSETVEKPDTHKADKGSLHQRLFNVEIMNLVKEQGKTIQKLTQEHRQQQERINRLADDLKKTKMNYKH